MEISLPHNYLPRPYQLPLLQAMDSGTKRAVVVWNRRSGKDKTLINIVAKKAFERVGAYYYFFPTYSQGKKVIWDGADKDGFRFLDHFPKALIESKNDTEMKIRFKNGSIFQIVGTDNIDSVVGTNPVGCVFSEYALQDPKAWDFIRPILAENGGWAIFGYTPRGMNHGWKLLQQARSSANWFVSVLTVDETKAIGLEELEEERRHMSPELFRQEYYCDFIEGASQFFKRIDENLWDGNAEPENHYWQLGVDLAKHLDWTVITPFDLTTFKVAKQERFNKIDYNLQKSRIEASYFRYNQGKIVIDSTGVGEPVYDDLVARGVSIEPYRFTEVSRLNLLNNLRILLEQDKIRIPNDPVLLNELRSMQYELSERGKIKISVPTGTHDDCVMSLALAVWGATMPVNPKNKEENFELYNQSFT